ncbi:MBL fold metallo-hydrolase [Thalassotalea profundi]|uniref:Metallo-beta-lactamase domain-containing protein n=1 Tax=Thalassotalea profundi TaxID=2036687 RepID=A0ABQ3IV91_9GAMM|nr:MBL fold metallo-hydrolase [Thalassotalea profundi]GHE95735.1 hypothetical protein GCM10011501_26600 [Thalassotalea profundi]
MKPINILVFSFILCWATTLSANSFQTLSNFSSQKLAENLFVLKSINSNTNIGVFIGEKSALLIDPVAGRGNNAVFAKAVADITGKPIKYVINSHNHIDHSGANSFYTELGAVIVVHAENDKHEPTQFVSFQETYSIDIGNEKIELVHIPSHSSHDILIHFKKSNVIFMGDTYMHNAYPHAFFAGSKGLNRVLDKALSLANDATKIVTAHGHFSSTKSELATFKHNANLWYQRIEWLHNQGQTKDDIVKDEELIKISKEFKAFSASFFEFMITKTLQKEHGV